MPSARFNPSSMLGRASRGMVVNRVRIMIIHKAHSGRAWLLYSLLVALILVPALVKWAFYPTYPGSDDAFIHLAIARNFAEGNGWGINPGEPVNLSSSPLFTFLLVLSNLLGLDTLTTGKVLSLLFTVGALLLLYHLLSALTESKVLRLSGVILGAFNVHLWRWNGVVMEISLAMLFVCLIFYLYYGRRKTASSGSGRYFSIGVTIGLATLVRYELALLLGCVLLDFLFNEKESRARGATILCTGFLIAVAPWFAFSYAYFGSFLPTTLDAKNSSVQWINASVLRQIASVVLSAYGLPLLAALVSLGYVVRNKPKWDVLRLLQRYLGLMLFPILLCSFYYLKTEWLQSPSRYILPALAVIPVIYVIVTEYCRERISLRWFRATVLATVAINAAIALSLNQLIIAPVLSSFDENYWATMRNVSSFLADRTGDDDVVLVVVDIGILSYYKHSFEIADSGGLASPELQGMSVPEQMAVTDPRYVVESIGQEKGSLAKSVPQLELIYYRQYRSHGTQSPNEQWFCNVYRAKSHMALSGLLTDN
jgi:hypothetical protein